MSAMEIVLLAAGAFLFVISYIIPAGKEEPDERTGALAQEEIKKLVSQEMESIRGQVDDVVEEAMSYAMEKTERSLERLSNEKIMAVNEYSDTVLKEIHKNHEEAMFLYDMLNSKHANLKNTVTQVDKTVKEVAETAREAEDLVNSFQKLAPPVLPQEAVAEKTAAVEKEAAAPPEKEPDISFMGQEEARNSNGRILELHRQGKSKVAIAKELGLGVGEVKLVIDLYKNL